MNHLRHLLLCSMFLLPTTIGCFSIKKVWNSWRNKEEHHKIIHKEYDLNSQEKVCLKTMSGDITVKTAWNNNKLYLTATIKASSPEELSTTHIAEKRTNSTLALCTQRGPESQSRVDYELIIPSNLATELITEQGNITVKQITKPALLATTDGNIHITKVQDSLIAHTHHTGSITVDHAQANIKATTTNGPITILDAHNNVIAHAQKGNIMVHCCAVPSTSSIELVADAGTITTKLPPEVNADLQAFTKKGKVTSNMFVTLKPRATQLNNASWKKMTQEVEGTLGSGEARIYLSTIKGDIKILETKVVA